jgi:hypothetical protein
MVLEPTIKSSHLVGQIGDRDTRTEEVRREDDAPIFETNLRVFELVAVGLFLPIFVTAGEVGRQTASYLLMIFEITKPFPEFTGCGHPDKGGGEGVQLVVELGRADTERAQVVAEHDLVR